jgi:nitronate monooxygenase
MRNAMAQFPLPAIAEQALQRYFLPGGRRERPYRGISMHSHRDKHASQDLLVLAAFVEVMLAKRDHHGRIGINLLTKVQIPTVPTLFGAMIAVVDYVLIGAGIPREVPGVLDRLAAMEPVETQLDVTGASAADMNPHLHFDPNRFNISSAPSRPAFLPIVSSHTLAAVLARKANGSVEGFIVEAPRAGGHNAPPRGTPTHDAIGQPLYGERDRVDLAAMRAIGLPFWLAAVGIRRRAFATRSQMVPPASRWERSSPSAVNQVLRRRCASPCSRPALSNPIRSPSNRTAWT